MSLEAQSVDANALEIQKDEVTKNLIEHLNKKFWATSYQGNNKKQNKDSQKKK